MLISFFLTALSRGENEQWHSYVLSDEAALEERNGLLART